MEIHQLSNSGIQMEPTQPALGGRLWYPLLPAWVSACSVFFPVGSAQLAEHCAPWDLGRFHTMLRSTPPCGLVNYPSVVCRSTPQCLMGAPLTWSSGVLLYAVEAGFVGQYKASLSLGVLRMGGCGDRAA